MENTYELVRWPDERLTTKATPIDAGVDTAAIAERMFATMAEEKGIGLAANQVGLLKRIIVLNVPSIDGSSQFKTAMVNPEIIQKSAEISEREEGCLSFPGVDGKVSRPTEVTVRWTTTDGKEERKTLSGLAGTCVQHEIDHLDGITYPQRLSPLKRQRLLEQYQKRRKITARNGGRPRME